MIPKIAHFFWHGGPLSYLRFSTLASFRKYNPDWKIRLYNPSEDCVAKTWTSHEVDDQGYEGIDYTDKLEDIDVVRHIYTPPLSNLAPAHACDLFQWEILSTVGGLFSDMDILYIKPIDSLYREVSEANAVFCLENDREMAIGFNLSSPNSIVFKKILNRAIANVNPNDYQCFGTKAVFNESCLGEGFIASDPKRAVTAIENLKKCNQDQKIVSLPYNTVYPYDWKRVEKILYGNYALLLNCVGIHWFGGAPLSQEANRTWTPHNLPDTTFTRLLREV